MTELTIGELKPHQKLIGTGTYQAEKPIPARKATPVEGEVKLEKIKALETAVTTDESLLGMHDTGFDPQRLQQLEAQRANIDLQIQAVETLKEEERSALRQQIYGPDSAPAVARPGRFGLKKFDASKPEDTEKMQKILRLQRLERPYGISPEIKTLFSQRNDIQSQTDFEREKRSDSQDLQEIVVELEKEKLIPPQSSSENEPLVFNDDPIFHTQFPRENQTSPLVKEIERAVQQEIWFHTTKHLDRIIQNKGLSTQSWVKTNDPKYYTTLVENSSSQGTARRNPELSSPFNKSDQDLLYFRADTTEFYGGQIIAYAPEDIIADNGLYVQIGSRHDTERVISDIADVKNDELGSTGESRLKLPLSSAIIAVPKGGFRDICRQFLLNGYSQEWITTHVFSYRGKFEQADQGRRTAVAEIKRRIAEKRAQNQTQLIALPNPHAKNAKIYQFQSVPANH